jgi:hypothetical protein
MGREQLQVRVVELVLMDIQVGVNPPLCFSGAPRLMIAAGTSLLAGLRGSGDGS